MNFLKKFGTIATQSLAVATSATPLIAAASQIAQHSGATKASTGLTAVIDGITTIEVIGRALDLKGAAKSEAAAPLIMDILLRDPQICALTGFTPPLMGYRSRYPIDVDQDAANAACVKIAGGIADFLNSIQDEPRLENEPVFPIKQSTDWTGDGARMERLEEVVNAVFQGRATRDPAPAATASSETK